MFKGTLPAPKPSRTQAQPWLWSSLERGPGWECCECKAGTGPFSRRQPQHSSAKAREQGPGRLGTATLSAKGRDSLPAAGSVPSSVCCQGQILPLPQRCWDQGVSPSNLEFQRLLFSLRKEQWGKSVSSQEQQGASLCPPVSITSTQGREGLNGTAGSPNSLSLSSHSTEDELALLTSPATPCIQEQAADSPGGGSKTQPRSRNTMPELNLASQCHLWGAAHSSASCTAPGEPGSCSGPPFHTAGCSCPSASLPPHHGCTEKHPHTAGLAA